MKRTTLDALLPLLLAAALAPLAVPTAARAQTPPERPPERPHPPPFYAITNARIVPVAGPVIESGTVVIADGLIQAVGSNAPVPPEAWTIDGEGLTVYPGLVDGLSDLGLAAPEAEDRPGASPGSGRQAGERQLARGPEDRPATSPWRAAADELRETDRRLETWRKGGFTAALTVPSEGIVAGQGAVIALAGDNPGHMVVRAPVALRLGLRPPGTLLRGFPGSLFGVLSYLEQLFLDADHYARAMAADRARPRGLERPAYDRTLEPIGRAVSEGWAVLIPGDEAREIRRAVRLGRRLGVRTVVYGAHDGHRLADELAAAGVPVLVSLKWPERNRDADPEEEESVHSLERRAEAPSTPAALHRAGARFAFYSGGLATPREALKNANRAIEEGLPAEAALRALTLGPAEVYGVADRLGSIERGKIANLVVTDGDLFDEKTKVRMVFVGGRKFEVREPSRPAEPPAADLSGRWTLTVQSPQGPRESTAELAMAEDGTLTGTVRSERGEGTITAGWVSGTRFSFTVLITVGGRTAESTYTGALEEGTLRGTVSVGRFSMEFTGTRPEGAAAVAGAARPAGTPAGQEPRPATVSETATPAAAREPRAATVPAAGQEPRPATVSETTTPAAAREPQPTTVSDAAIRTVQRVTWSPVDWSAPAPTILIRNATLLTAAEPFRIENGSILVRDGKIAAVGPAAEVRAPEGARVIDGTGRYVTPGIIDAHAHIAADAINEGSVPVSSMVRIEDVLDPTNINIYREAAGGVTTSHVMHGSANPIGGQNAIIKHRWGADAEGLLLRGAPPTIKFALGENPKRSNFRPPPAAPPWYPQTRMGVMDVIRRAFAEAREYEGRWRAHERRLAAGERNPVPPRRDLKLEPLVEILKGRRLVHAHSYRADEILQLMRVAEEFGFTIAVFQHVLEGYRVADELAAHGAAASTFSDWWAYKVEAYEAIPHNAALMTERGVVVSINSDSPEEARHLNQEAAKAMKWGGLSEEEALALVTINPAAQLRIDGRTGSIETGKDADLVIWEGHPLSAYARTLTTLVDGRVVFDVEEDRRRQEWLAERREELRRKLGEAEEPRTAGRVGKGGAR